MKVERNGGLRVWGRGLRRGCQMLIEKCTYLRRWQILSETGMFFIKHSYSNHHTLTRYVTGMSIEGLLAKGYLGSAAARWSL